MLSELVRGNDKIMVTPEGGIATRWKNKTGAPSIKGTLVECHGTEEEAVAVAGVDDYAMMGFMYSDGVPDGGWCWVVTGHGSIAEALVEDGTAVGLNDLIICGGTTAGRVESWGAIPPPPTDAVHFRECGHARTSCTAGTDNLIKILIHFL